MLVHEIFETKKDPYKIINALEYGADMDWEDFYETLLANSFSEKEASKVAYEFRIKVKESSKPLQKSSSKNPVTIWGIETILGSKSKIWTNTINSPGPWKTKEEAFKHIDDVIDDIEIDIDHKWSNSIIRVIMV